MCFSLVVEPTHLKNMLVKLDHETPGIGDEHKKIFEVSPPRFFLVFPFGFQTQATPRATSPFSPMPRRTQLLGAKVWGHPGGMVS